MLVSQALDIINQWKPNQVETLADVSNKRVWLDINSPYLEYPDLMPIIHSVIVTFALQAFLCTS